MYQMFNSDFWKIQNPNIIQLYSLATPNGQKVGVALEELELPYEVHVVNILKDEQFRPEFLEISPNNKIPAIIDPNGPEGKPLALSESAAILYYLAEKAGRLIPEKPLEKLEMQQWCYFQMASLGPMFGQFGHFFKYAKDKCDHPYPVERFTNETRRILDILEKRLQGKEYVMPSGYTIADILMFPWVECLDNFYQASEHLKLSEFAQVMSWLERCKARPAVKKGMTVATIPD